MWDCEGRRMGGCGVRVGGWEGVDCEGRRMGGCGSEGRRMGGCGL